MKEELLRLRTKEMDQTQVTEANFDSERMFSPAYMAKYGFEDLKTSLKSIKNDLQDLDGNEIVNNLIGKTSGLEDRAGRLQTNIYDLSLRRKNAVPNTPYKDDWYKMGIKNLLLDAIDEGKDAISISKSDAMIDRYTDEYETFYKTLYDKKIPSFMKKLANQYGGKFEEGKLDHRDTYTKFAPLTSNEQKNLESTIIKTPQK